MLKTMLGSIPRLRRLGAPPDRGGASLPQSSDKFCPNVYGDEIPWEIPVQLNLRDVLDIGDCALDVGANIGGLAIAMSRMVGLGGSVHAFEANPRTLPRLQADLLVNRAANVTVVPKAAWSKSGETIPFYCDHSHYAAASSVHRRSSSWHEVRVHTVSLDDYCQANALSPTAIKLDVEGAEYDVLLGARWLIERHAPSWVMEYQPADEAGRDPLEFLRSHGYTIYDSNLYRVVDRAFYLTNFTRVPLVNVLAISPGSAAIRRYRDISLRCVAHIDCPKGSLRTDALALPEAGRYIIAADFDGPPQTLAGLRVADSEGRSLAYFETDIAHLQEHSCSSLVVQADRAINVYCELSSPEPAELSLRSVKVTQIGFA